ncbi:MAG: hypothetical protein QM302_07900 [Acidobacteriota bacterium]|nr:hypothetical protein [Acidobacteriota bacterium]
MNELMMYEDLRDELGDALGEFANDEVVNELCERWVLHLNMTRAEASRPPRLIPIPQDVALPAGFDGAAYVLSGAAEDVPGDRLKADDASRNATGPLDQPRLCSGRMFQAKDVLLAMGIAFLKARVGKLAIEVIQAPGSADPLSTYLASLPLASAPDLIGDLKSFVAKKRAEGPRENAVVIMAFSEYECDMHDTKNEPFSAEAMVAWLSWARDSGAKEMPPRVRDSVRAVANGSWDPTVKEVEQILSNLAGKGFFRKIDASGSAQLYCINV